MNVTHDVLDDPTLHPDLSTIIRQLRSPSVRVGVFRLPDDMKLTGNPSTDPLTGVCSVKNHLSVLMRSCSDFANACFRRLFRGCSIGQKVEAK